MSSFVKRFNIAGTYPLTNILA